MNHCLNCEKSFEKGNSYCSECGQKTHLGKLTLLTVVRDFLRNFFNLETKIWRSLRDIWKPGKLTIAYIEGRRTTYYNPIRLFLVALFAFVALTIFLAGNIIDMVSEMSKTQEHNAWLLVAEERLDSLKLAISDENLQLIKDDVLHKESLNLNADTSALIKFELPDSTEFSDFFILDDKELVEKIKPDNKLEEITLLSFRKLIQSPRDSMKFIIGNGTWLIILMVLVISLWFKLIYLRRLYTYVEHFIFHLYGHTRILILGLLHILLSYALPSDANEWLWASFGIIITVYLYLEMKRCYKQSHFKTFLKFFLTSFVYLFIIQLIITGVFIVSLMLL